MHDTLDYLLCISVAAAAALVQDSPASFSRQSAIVLFDPLGTSLDLRRQAVEVADRQGLLRKPSLQGLQILRLLCLLHSGTSRLPAPMAHAESMRRRQCKDAKAKRRLSRLRKGHGRSRTNPSRDRRIRRTAHQYLLLGIGAMRLSSLRNIRSSTFIHR
jgi:hypothetical protein